MLDGAGEPMGTIIPPRPRVRKYELPRNSRVRWFAGSPARFPAFRARFLAFAARLLAFVRATRAFAGATIAPMPHEFDVVQARDVKVQGSLDRRLSEVAERQHGVVARFQLLALGFGREAIEHRRRTGRLRPLHRGVYAVGHRCLRVEGRWMAALLAAGNGAVLSHRSAAALWGLRRASGLIEVTTPIPRRARAGLRLHTSPLAEDEVTQLHRIPTTTVARTLLDLAGVLPPQHLEAAIHEAEYRRLVSAGSLAALLERYPRRRGNTAVRRVLAAGVGRYRTRSEMEARFLAFLDARHLPRPETNVARTVHGRWIEADGAYVAARLIVELDGWAGHGTRRRFESDRARDRANLADGWRTIRITWRQLHEEGEELAADLRRLLSPEES